MFNALELTIGVPPYVLRPGGLEGPKPPKPFSKTFLKIMLAL